MVIRTVSGVGRGSLSLKRGDVLAETLAAKGPVVEEVCDAVEVFGDVDPETFGQVEIIVDATTAAEADQNALLV